MIMPSVLTIQFGNDDDIRQGIVGYEESEEAVVQDNIYLFNSSIVAWHVLSFKNY